MAQELGLEVTVCHYPPRTSKWNRIEHRMFSFITMNWRGRPLVSYRTIIELISATETKSLKLRADLDPRTYATKVRVSEAELATVPLEPHIWHWGMELHHRVTRSINWAVSPKETPRTVALALSGL